MTKPAIAIILSLMAIGALSPPQSAVAIPNKVLEWKMEGQYEICASCGTGGVPIVGVEDTSGNNLHGVFGTQPPNTGFTLEFVNDGVTDQAVSVFSIAGAQIDVQAPPPGEDQIMGIGDTSLIPYRDGDPFTVSMFVRFAGQSPVDCCFDARIGGIGEAQFSANMTNRNIWYLRNLELTDSELVFVRFNPGPDLGTGESWTLADDLWRFLAITHDGNTTAEVYSFDLNGNGGRVGFSDTFDLLETAQGVFISKGSSADETQIDDFVVWDDVLTQQDLCDQLPGGGAGGSGCSVVADNADFNGNNLVDGADMLIYQRNFGTDAGNGNVAPQSDGNANGDQFIDAVDGEIWESQYGGPPPGAAASTAVPEPSALLLAMLATLMGVSSRRQSFST